MEKRIGLHNTSSEGYDMVCVEYINSRTVIVSFGEGNEVSTYWSSFKKGQVKNPFHRSVCGVGYLGGTTLVTRENGKDTKPYKVWHSMISRCYNEKSLESKPTYRDCSVCEEWHSYHKFYDWFQNNYYEIEGEEMQLDKDILNYGNKQYSPFSCVFVPKSINTLFINKQEKNSDLPPGITRNSAGSYKVRVSIGGRREYLGTFTSLEEAMGIYVKAREYYVRNVAHMYKDKIPDKLFKALINYKEQL